MDCNPYDTPHTKIPAHPCTLANGDPCPPCTKSLSIENSISEASELLKSLEAQRIPIRLKINNKHDPLARLPPGIVSSIFLNFLPEHWSYEYSVTPRRAQLGQVWSPLQLGSISRTWRQIVWSTPQLWTSISVNLCNKNPCIGDLIKAWLKRSGNLPLCVCLYADGDLPLPFGKNGYIMETIEAVASYSRRWTFVNLELPLVIMKRLHCASHSQPRLKYLRLSVVPHGRDDKSKTYNRININADCSTLEQLDTSFLRFNQVAFYWTNITRATVDGYYIDECFQVLLHAPQLTHLEVMTVIMPPDRMSVSAVDSVVQHKCLRVLKFSHSRPGNTNQFLRLTTFPALKEYTHNTCRLFEKLPVDTIISQMERSCCLLNKLTLHQMHKLVDCSELIELLRATPTLKWLNFTCVVEQQCYLDPFLEIMAPPADQPQHVRLLPHLEELQICGPRNFSWNQLPSIFGTDFTALEEEGCTTYQRPLHSVYIALDSIEASEPIDQDVVLQLIHVIEHGVEVRLLGHVPEGDCRRDILQSSIELYGL